MERLDKVDTIFLVNLPAQLEIKDEAMLGSLTKSIISLEEEGKINVGLFHHSGRTVVITKSKQQSNA